jgi:hypothetical protein
MDCYRTSRSTGNMSLGVRPRDTSAVSLWLTSGDTGFFAYATRALPADTLVVLDGAEGQSLFHYSLSLMKSRDRATPRPHPKHLYVRREWTPATAKSRYCHAVPTSIAKRIRAPQNLRQKSFSIPREKLQSATTTDSRTRVFPSHIVDQEVGLRQPLRPAQWCHPRCMASSPSLVSEVARIQRRECPAHAHAAQLRLNERILNVSSAGPLVIRVLNSRCSPHRPFEDRTVALDLDLGGER